MKRIALDLRSNRIRSNARGPQLRPRIRRPFLFRTRPSSPSRRETSNTASILIRDGKIAAVGADLKAPDGVAVIDATGQFVIPGIIDCHSHIAVDGSVNEGGPAVSSMANIADVLNPEDISIYDDLAGGVTVANVLHGSANPDWRPDRRHQTALGQARQRVAFRRRASGNQIRSRRKSEALRLHAAARNSAALPGLRAWAWKK